MSPPSDRVRLAIFALIAVNLFTAIGIFFAPGEFYDQVANFGARSDHLLRDSGTFNLAAVVALTMSLSRPSWRAPVLLFVTLQFAFHAINHVYDSGDAATTFMAWFDVASLAAVCALAAWALRAAQAEDGSRA